MKSLTYFKDFIADAEGQFYKVVQCERIGKIVTINDLTFREIADLSFNSRSKIYQFFRKYWGESYARRLMCNLGLLEIDQHLYAIYGDPPPLPIEVVSMSIKPYAGDKVLIRSILAGDPSGDKIIYYLVQQSQNTGRYEILRRTFDEGDIRYKRCKSPLSKY